MPVRNDNTRRQALPNIPIPITFPIRRRSIMYLQQLLHRFPFELKCIPSVIGGSSLIATGSFYIRLWGVLSTPRHPTRLLNELSISLHLWIHKHRCDIVASNSHWKIIFSFFARFFNQKKLRGTFLSSIVIPQEILSFVLLHKTLMSFSTPTSRSLLESLHFESNRVKAWARCRAWFDAFISF